MGGTPFGESEPYPSYDAIADYARNANGGLAMLMIPPFMHGAAQWSTFHTITSGGTIVMPDDVRRPGRRERHGRGRARAGAQHLCRRRRRSRCRSSRRSSAGSYDLSGLVGFGNGGAALTPAVRDRILEALPHIMVMDAAGCLRDRAADEPMT